MLSIQEITTLSLVLNRTLDEKQIEYLEKMWREFSHNPKKYPIFIDMVNEELEEMQK